MNIERKKYEKSMRCLTEALLCLPKEMREAYMNKRNWMPFIPYLDYKREDNLLIVSEQTAQRIEMLLGPNANTVIRIWVIKNLP